MRFCDSIFARPWGEICFARQTKRIFFPQPLLFRKPEKESAPYKRSSNDFLTAILEQDIEREIYHTEKAKLLSEKKSLEEQMARIEQKRNGWLEPRLGQPRGARERAERRGFVGAKRHPRKSRSIF